MDLVADTRKNDMEGDEIDTELDTEEMKWKPDYDPKWITDVCVCSIGRERQSGILAESKQAIIGLPRASEASLPPISSQVPLRTLSADMLHVNLTRAWRWSSRRRAAPAPSSARPPPLP